MPEDATPKTRPIYVIMILKNGDRLDLPVEVGLPAGELSDERHVKAALKAALSLRPDGRIIGSY